MERSWQARGARALAPALVGLLAAALGALLLGAGDAVPLLAAGSEAAAPTVAATGSATVTAPPDMAHVSVGAVSLQPTAAQAMGDVDRIVGAVGKALASLGVDARDIRTAGLQLGPRYGDDGTTVTGFEAEEDLDVTVRDLDLAGRVLDAALRAGANRLGGIAFGWRDDASLRAQAIAQAVADARAQAEAAAGAAGLRILGVESIEIQGGGPIIYHPGVAAAPAEVNVYPGESSLTVTVRVVYRVGP